MASVLVRQAPLGGFDFANCRRNNALDNDFTQKGHKLAAARKTGTTIAGVVFKDGIILGADTRATEGMIVADKNCSKIHFIAPNIYCCGAGTAADTEMTTQMISSNIELHSLSTGRQPRVATANRMLKQMLFRYQGYIGAALVLGGVDCSGPHLYSIYPHGSTDKLPYVTMGSGSLAAMAVFEDRYKPEMEYSLILQIISLPADSCIFCCCCERICSMFTNIHTKSRNKLTCERGETLVSIRANLTFLEVNEKNDKYGGRRNRKL
uniref:Proteasome subunit beta n=1 Tax=Leptobrachium leishanense TaxID=445787 RepID=A0A8C5Q7N9_9ANUR